MCRAGNGRPKGVFGETVFFRAPFRLALKTPENPPRFWGLELMEKMVLSISEVWTTVSPHDAFSTPLAPATYNFFCTDMVRNRRRRLAGSSLR